MSLIFSTEEGWIISHLQHLNSVYKTVKNGDLQSRLMFNETLFEINSQYLRENQITKCSQREEIPLQSTSKKRKRSKLLPDDDLKEINYVKQTFDKVVSLAKAEGLFSFNITPDNNEAARIASQKVYQDTFSSEGENFYGCNDADVAITSEVKDKRYVFPEKCSFYCYDVRDLAAKLELKNQYDFILLDPPWWNKSIRRKKTRYLEAR